MNSRSRFDEILPTLPLIGMVHLAPLPGSPRCASDMTGIVERALADLAALHGVDAVIVENYGDAPFYPARVPAETVAAMSVVVREIVRSTDAPVGVNVLRNDAESAIAIAAVTGARFIRVNVLSGTMYTDQGPITGSAHRVLRERDRLAPGLAIAADVFVKHAVPPAGIELGTMAADTWERALPDALIVSGTATGAAVDTGHLRAVRGAVPDARIWIGSGLTVRNADEILPLCDGAIVGSSLNHADRAGQGVDRHRVLEMTRAFSRIRQESE